MSINKRHLMNSIVHYSLCDVRGCYFFFKNFSSSIRLLHSQ